MNKWIIVLTVFIAGSGWSCEKKSPYERMVQRELNSGVRQDSLFLDLSFGMTQQEFYDHCTELNQRRLATEGPGGVTVEHILPNADPQIVMHFSPVFKEGKITMMGARFFYVAWAPWNRDLWAPELQKHLMTLVTTWYGGNEFQHWQNAPYGPVYVKVDGNRQIVIGCEDDQYVRIIYTDLTEEEDNLFSERPGSLRQ